MQQLTIHTPVGAFQTGPISKDDVLRIVREIHIARNAGETAHAEAPIQFQDRSGAIATITPEALKACAWVVRRVEEPKTIEGRYTLGDA